MTLMEEIRRRPSGLMPSLVMLPCYFVTGIWAAMTGPTMLDLKEQTGSSLTQISLCLTARSAGAAVGAFLSE